MFAGALQNSCVGPGLKQGMKSHGRNAKEPPKSLFWISDSGWWTLSARCSCSQNIIPWLTLKRNSAQGVLPILSEKRIKKTHKECSPATVVGVLVESGIGTAERRLQLLPCNHRDYRGGDFCGNNQEGHCILFLNRKPALPSMAGRIKRMAWDKWSFSQNILNRSFSPDEVVYTLTMTCF